MLSNKITNYFSLTFKKQFSTTIKLNRRPPPEAEFKNNLYNKRKTTADPFDRRWRWTPKSAEPYNVYGGDIRWTQLPFLRRGVQIPGYVDKKTGKFVFIDEMVPEIVAPDLKDCNLKPYVPYNVEEVNEDAFTPKKLFDEIYQDKIKLEFEKEYEAKNIGSTNKQAEAK